MRGQVKKKKVSVHDFPVPPFLLDWLEVSGPFKPYLDIFVVVPLVIIPNSFLVVSGPVPWPRYVHLK